MNVFSPLTTLSVRTALSYLLGSQHCTLQLSLSLLPPPFISVVLPTAPGKERDLILHTAPRNSACSLCCYWISQPWSLWKLPLRETGRIADRQMRADWQACRQMKKNTKNQRHNSNAREKTFAFILPLLCCACMRACVGLCSVWSHYFSKGDATAWAWSIESI